MNEDNIRTKVGTIKCPQGECVRVAQEMVEILLGGKCIIKEQVECNSLENALIKIDNFLTEDNLVVIWSSSGFIGSACNCPAWHSYLVFNTKPLQSFSAWECGIEFYDEVRTKEAIEKTINSEKHNKVITIQQYERNS